KSVGTLWAVAQSISRAAVLRELAGSGIAEVVAAALANKHAPQDVLAAAAKDRRAGREGAVSNPAARAETLRAAASHPDTLPQIGSRIIDHPNCPRSLAAQIWDRLCGDGYLSINLIVSGREQIRRRPDNWARRITCHFAERG